MLEDKANLVLLQRLMTAPTLESYVAQGRETVAEWAQLRFQHRNKPPDGAAMPPPRAPPEGAGVDDDRVSNHDGATTRDAKATATIKEVPETAAEAGGAAEVGGAGGEDWWCVKAAGGNGGLDIWVLHEGNWKSVTEQLSVGESYVIQVRAERVLHAMRRFIKSWLLEAQCCVLGETFCTISAGRSWVCWAGCLRVRRRIIF